MPLPHHHANGAADIPITVRATFGGAHASRYDENVTRKRLLEVLFLTMLLIVVGEELIELRDTVRDKSGLCAGLRYM